MTKADGIYHLSNLGGYFEQGAQIEFKVVEDHSWDNQSWPENNYLIYIHETGAYSFDITFNPADSKVSVDMNKVR